MKILVFIFLIISIKGLSQPNWDVKNDFDIKKWEVKIEHQEKLNKLKNANLESLLKIFKNLNTKIENEIDNFHFGYFNQDSKLDLMYIGNLGLDFESYYIYLNQENKLNHILTIGSIKELVFEDDFDLPIIKVLIEPCCADYVYKFEIYKPSSDIEYKQPIIYFYDEGTEFPNQIDLEQNFEISLELYHLRRTPIIDNSKNDFNASPGNICHSYSKGDMGKAFASNKDETGRIWWFVEMKNPKLKEGKHFPKKGTYYIGWMSSRYVTKI